MSRIFCHNYIFVNVCVFLLNYSQKYTIDRCMADAGRNFGETYALDNISQSEES